MSRSVLFSKLCLKWDRDDFIQILLATRLKQEPKFRGHRDRGSRSDSDFSGWRDLQTVTIAGPSSRGKRLRGAIHNVKFVEKFRNFGAGSQIQFAFRDPQRNRSAFVGSELLPGRASNIAPQIPAPAARMRTGSIR